MHIEVYPKQGNNDMRHLQILCIYHYNIVCVICRSSNMGLPRLQMCRYTRNLFFASSIAGSGSAWEVRAMETNVMDWYNLTAFIWPFHSLLYSYNIKPKYDHADVIKAGPVTGLPQWFWSTHIVISLMITAKVARPRNQRGGVCCPTPPTLWHTSQPQHGTQQKGLVPLSEH